MANLRSLIDQLHIIENQQNSNIKEAAPLLAAPLAAAGARAIAAKVAARAAAKKAADQTAKKAGQETAGTAATTAGKEGIPLTDFGTVGAKRAAQQQQAVTPQVFRQTPRGPETAPQVFRPAPRGAAPIAKSDIKKGLDIAAAARQRDAANLQKQLQQQRSDVERMSQKGALEPTIATKVTPTAPTATTPTTSTLKFQKRTQDQTKLQEPKTDLGKIIPGERPKSPPELDSELKKKALKRSLYGHGALGLGLAAPAIKPYLDRIGGETETGKETSVDQTPIFVPDTNDSAQDRSDISTQKDTTAQDRKDTTSTEVPPSRDSEKRAGTDDTGGSSNTSGTFLDREWPPRQPLDYARERLRLKETFLKEYTDWLDLDKTK